MYDNLSSWRELALAFLLSGPKSQPLPRKCWDLQKSAKEFTDSRLLGSCECLRYFRECQVSYVVHIATDREIHYKSNYRGEMPIAAFSLVDASQNSYFSATLKKCCISSGVGGAGGLFGSNGRASSLKKL